MLSHPHFDIIFDYYALGISKINSFVAVINPKLNPCEDSFASVLPHSAYN